MSFDLNQTIRGRAWKFGDSIDTDCINPFYRYANDPEEIKKHTMESARPEFAAQVKAGDILVAGRNFGCGSARTGKVLFEVGVAAVLAESFSTLFMRNCISGGDFILVVPGITGLVNDGDTLEISYREGKVRNATRGGELPFKTYPPMIEGLFRNGGILPYTRARYDAEAGASARA